jgi:hypothetical protein
MGRRIFCVYAGSVRDCDPDYHSANQARLGNRHTNEKKIKSFVEMSGIIYYVSVR